MESYTGIRPSPEYAKKRLAQYAVNVGMRCPEYQQEFRELERKIRK